jgi:hypothetical protein
MKTLSQLFWLDHAGTVGGRCRLVRGLIVLWQRAEDGSTERFSIGDESVTRRGRQDVRFWYPWFQVQVDHRGYLGNGS